MRLSILDQSPISKGITPQQALTETVQLARLADRMGYTRFWVAEHHNTTSLAGSTPEILITHLAEQTDRIRVGSGGVMLPHYSALKVAENFRMLETLFPGRIDLGIGRAPGSDRLTASLLNPNNTFNEQDFIEQLSDLQHYLNDSHEPGTPQSRVKATPLSLTVPEQWILSSSGQSGLFAAHFGMAFSFAHFINPIGGSQAVRTYRERFKPSENLSQPMANVAVFVFCSESEEKVRQQQAIVDYRFIQFETKGRFEPVSYEDVQFASYSLAELERIRYNRQRFITGTPDQLKAKLSQLAKDYDVEEVMAVNITLDFEDRMHSFELLAEAFNLQQVTALR